MQQKRYIGLVYARLFELLSVVHPTSIETNVLTTLREAYIQVYKLTYIRIMIVARLSQHNKLAHIPPHLLSLVAFARRTNRIYFRL